MSLAALALSIDLNDARYAWRAYGACARPDIDPELFFPERGQSTGEAKAICARCPVKDVCLEVALANGEKFGIWGGLSERERRRIRKQRRLENTNNRSGDKTDLGDRLVAELERRGGTWWITVAGIADFFGVQQSSVKKDLSILHTDSAITTTHGTYGDTTTPVIVAIHLNEGTTP